MKAVVNSERELLALNSVKQADVNQLRKPIASGDVMPPLPEPPADGIIDLVLNPETGVWEVEHGHQAPRLP